LERILLGSESHHLSVANDSHLGDHHDFNSRSVPGEVVGSFNVGLPTGGHRWMDSSETISTWTYHGRREVGIDHQVFGAGAVVVACSEVFLASPSQLPC
jgi:hypothetical protein